MPLSEYLKLEAVNATAGPPGKLQEVRAGTTMRTVLPVTVTCMLAAWRWPSLERRL
jgi:hypothetical protein